MPTQAWSLLSPCIAVRSNHFQVTAKSAYYGRSRTFCAVGLYSGGVIGSAYACHSPPRTKPRFASLGPKGSLSLTQKSETQIGFRSQKKLISSKSTLQELYQHLLLLEYMKIFFGVPFDFYFQICNSLIQPCRLIFDL